MFTTEILNAAVEFIKRPFIVPLQLSTGPITEITEARAQVTVRVDGREAVGRGAMYLSDLWAWPDPALTHEARDAALREYTTILATALRDACGGEAAHPMELGLRLHEKIAHGAPSAIPLLARTMCASPFDAAIHDGAGQSLGRPAFHLYSGGAAIPSGDPYFSAVPAAEAVRRTIARPPKTALDAWVIVNKTDTAETLRPWVLERGYRCFKLKIMGKDNAADVARTIEVERMVRELGVKSPKLTVDSNEANPDAASVLDYLERLRAEAPGAFEALLYLEQPTGRDISVHAHDWRRVTRLKPVLLDEGLTRLELFEEAALQGWSGFALKTCKGHSFALLAAAWAAERGMPVAVQDLTNPGLAAIHSALFAAHVPSVNGVELNSPQFTPAANAEWLPRLAGLLEPRDGHHRLPEGGAPVGLGSHL